LVAVSGKYSEASPASVDAMSEEEYGRLLDPAPPEDEDEDKGAR
jgi:hypothetical protein